VSHLSQKQSKTRLKITLVWGMGLGVERGHLSEPGKFLDGGRVTPTTYFRPLSQTFPASPSAGSERHLWLGLRCSQPLRSSSRRPSLLSWRDQRSAGRDKKVKEVRSLTPTSHHCQSNPLPLCPFSLSSTRNQQYQDLSRLELWGSKSLTPATT
jgi:hypothetical protein